ncbi:interleukin-7 receptor subunit alpha isoform X2 [Denticeps clupeoides]|nr:interleukin-7 receptor subunit alpha isoform X2 [Denticeps clupeoides]
MLRDVWMSLFLLTATAGAQSGDGDAEIPWTCFSEVTFENTSLTCTVDEEIADDITNITLCLVSGGSCKNGSLRNDDFTINDLRLLQEYNLTVQLKQGESWSQIIDNRKIVNAPTPRIVNMTYYNDLGTAYFTVECKHDYLQSFKYEVELWTENIVKTWTLTSMPLTIVPERLTDGSVYNVKVRVKPRGYFAGSWSQWSPWANFTTKTVSLSREEENAGFSLYPVVIIIVIILLLVAILVALFWKKELRGYILPKVPHPKATLVQMQKFNKGFSVSFNPEVYNDIHIHKLDNNEQRQHPCEPSSGTMAHCLTQPGQETSTRLLSELEHTLPGDHNLTSLSLGTPQRDCVDEAYVRMSSLFKNTTQSY